MLDLIAFFKLLAKLGLISSKEPPKPHKSDIIIHKALEGHRRLVAAKVREELCTECHDRRCDKGMVCRRYEQQVDQEAWEMASHENN